MQSVEPSHADEQMGIGFGSGLSRVGRAENLFEMRTDCGKLPFRPESDVNLQRVFQEEYPEQNGTSHHVHVSDRFISLIEAVGPLGDDLLVRCRGSQAQRQIDIGPAVQAGRRGGSGMRRTAKTRINLRGRDEFGAELLSLVGSEEHARNTNRCGCRLSSLGKIPYMLVTLATLRRLTVSQSLFSPTTLKRALHRMQFVQADPIRSPARAQDLILRHRVKDYRAGDLERRYASLGVHEDFFINYGFVTRELQAWMHPRADCRATAENRLPWPAARRKRAMQLLDFVRQRGTVHPRDLDEHFSHGKVTNYWGGSSNSTTHLLDAMHYQGLLRVVRRDAGIRIYAAHDHSEGPTEKAACQANLDALADTVIRIYAPLPLASLRFVLRRLRYAAPQWEDDIPAATQRAKHRLAHAQVEGTDWYWPADWKIGREEVESSVRLLAPFDPVVWDRWRFEKLWGWMYRFEAYTPAAKRVRGYYAMPLLWRDHVIGWANLSVEEDVLHARFGYVTSEPRDRVFRQELQTELENVRRFLRLQTGVQQD